MYNDTGIFGITASAETKFAGQSVDKICQEMLVTSPLLDVLLMEVFWHHSSYAQIIPAAGHA